MKIGRLLLATYLGTSPVFWFWNLPPRVVLLTKWLLILAGFAVIWLRAYQRRLLVLPVGLPGPNGFVLLVVSMAFGFFQSGAEAILETVADIVYPLPYYLDCVPLKFPPFGCKSPGGCGGYAGVGIYVRARDTVKRSCCFTEPGVSTKTAAVG